MKLKRFNARALVLAVVLVLTSCAANDPATGVRAAEAAPGARITVSYFYESLAPDGQWFEDPAYGWCWTPDDVSATWRPYRDGHWEYTDYGWSWVSDESWGWAPYHYGRWFVDDRYGWAWVPGTEWAPAWVAWRDGDDWMGWAPLPPMARWDSGGLSYADFDAMPADRWCFVPRRHFMDVSLRLQVTSVARNVTLVGRSHNATRYENHGGRPANMGPDVAAVEVALGRRVPRSRIADADTPSRGNGRAGADGAVRFYRPVVEAAPVTQAPAPPAVVRRGAAPVPVAQRQRDAQSRKLESDLATERTRLGREQRAESKAQPAGEPAEKVRVQHAAEQQAFEAHAARQRQVQAQRVQQQQQHQPKQQQPERVKQQSPQRAPERADKPAAQEKDKGKGRDKGGE